MDQKRRKAILQELVAEVLVESRSCIRPTFRLPLDGVSQCPKWCAWRESNPLPCGPEPHALSGELQAQRHETFKFTLGAEMRLPHAMAAAGVVAWLALAACDGVGAPPPDPTRIGLQQGDLPATLDRCPASGDVDGFVRSLQRSDPAAHDELLTAWRDLQRRGAVQAAVTVYAAQPAACSARLGTGDGTSVTSVVVRLRDDGAAAAVYQGGVLGFTTPSEDAEVPGMTRGAATGFGRNAWVLESSVQGRSLIVGLWERNAVLVLVVAVDADPLHAKQAMATVDGRIL
jgi:hypothetical protein